MKQQYTQLILLFSGIILLVFSACNNKQEIKKEVLPTQLDTISLNPPVFKTSYRLDSISGQEHLDSLFNNFSDEEARLIYTLNRIDKHRVKPGTKLIIPDSLVSDLKVYAPFPTLLEPLDAIDKTVIISKRIQAFALYKNGNLLHWGPVSTGKQSTGTPAGLYYGNYKAKRKISTIDKSWIMPYYFNFMNFEGIGTHEYTLPGYPASHGCVRMYQEDAKFIYDWASMWELENDVIVQNGTPFMVIGEYDFQDIQPWFKLEKDQRSNELSKKERDTLRVYAQRYKNDPLNFKFEDLSDQEIVL
ncbi:L,D-transpeptidase [Salegentibacter salegens]|uniref:Lipoprotein-anchoring transpeptidase ErfK/SrfK n=1 Tax=Salegentibacter salegens TaxID=143223 RepID=A0A1M7KGG8_9FLAO|nr:L,D-transpeptidase [Salegentibacter salegens]PRX49636.1 lipoprotein-anchoring transpeptidase ErfK/SrfK [Salegentibacter salegens]SHM64184.1 Lipoprotein-anchoring transpeptidase ErfK/SrfK [Salegentibacter salegens]